MARLSNEEINAIREKADIVQVVSHYLPLHRAGKDYKGVCPFHDDHSPSMTVSPDLQIYKCFVCGAGGSVFRFVENYEKISFVEAVSRVADLSGIAVSIQPEAMQVQRDPHKEALYKVLNDTISYTSYQLDTPEAAKEKEYLEKRGLNASVRSVFGIGYNPISTSLTAFLKAKGAKDADIVSANVGIMTDRGIRDVFSGRITFPIHDRKGNPIGFSARTLHPEDTSKYINTNETDIFKKGEIVYNSHRAAVPARHAGCVYVCEGVTDVIAFYRAGLENAVCTLGTACTAVQIRILKSLAPRIVFCYDGDNAGQSATWRAAKMAQEAGCTIAIVQNRTGKDPDEILRDQGAEALKEMVSHEISWMEFVLEYLSARTNMDSYLEKKEMVRKAQEEIALLPDDSDKAYFTEQLSLLSGFRLTFTPLSGEKTVYAKSSSRLTVPDGTKQAEELLLKMMMVYPAATKRFEERLGYLIGKENRTLALMIVDATHTYGSVRPSILVDETDDENIQNLISRLATAPDYGQPYDEKIVDGVIRKVQTKVIQNEADAYKAQLAADLNPQSRELILKKYGECLRELRRLIDEENSRR